jgi:[CysO sulfur-carrier protein]-S-L-cysteine hydrolase
MRMTRVQWDELIAHAQEETPNECCGYAYGHDGALEQTVRAHNPRRSPYGYELDPKSLLVANDLYDDGYEVAIYHSHPRSAAEPSQTDINLATYPHWVYLIVSLADEPHVRAWRIADGKVDEEPIEVVE